MTEDQQAPELEEVLDLDDEDGGPLDLSVREDLQCVVYELFADCLDAFEADEIEDESFVQETAEEFTDLLTVPCEDIVIGESMMPALLAQRIKDTQANRLTLFDDLETDEDYVFAGVLLMMQDMVELLEDDANEPMEDDEMTEEIEALVAEWVDVLIG